MSLYRCAACKGEFMSDWSDKEAEDEYERLFGHPMKPQEVDVLCDDCFKAALERVQQTGLLR